MPTLDTLTRKDFEYIFSLSVLRKGEEMQPFVGTPVRRGDQLLAKVLGTKLYDVEIQVGSFGILSACTCPVGSSCKHVAAVLLYWLKHPGSFRAENVDPPTADGLDVIPVALPAPKPPTRTSIWLGTPFVERQTREREILRAMLDQKTVADLREMAAARGWRLSGTRKSDIVAQVLELLLSVGEAAKAIYSLDAGAQQVLRSLALHTGSQVVLGRTVEQTALAQGPLQKYDKASAYIYDLVSAGLAFPTVSGTINVPATPALTPDLVPFALARNFPPLLETVVPSTWEMEKTETGHTVHLADPTAVVRAIQNLLLFFEQDPPALRPPQPRPRIEKVHPGLQRWNYNPQEVIYFLGQASLNRQNQSADLTVPPPGYALTDDAMQKLLPLSQDLAHLDFLYALLAAAGLVQSGSPVKPWPPSQGTYLGLRPEVQHAALVRSYFQMNDWSELWEMQRQEPRFQMKRHTSHTSLQPEMAVAHLAEYRRLLVRLLAYLPDNRWLSAEKIAPLLQAFWTRFAGPPSVYSSARYLGWFLAWDGRELDEEKREDWRRGPWAFFSAILRGPLRWLGLADLVLAGGEVQAFRLHGLADLYWDRVEALSFADLPKPGADATDSASEEDSSAALTVEKGGRIRVDTAVITAPGHALLRRIAQVTSSMVGLFVYKLDRDAVYATFESGVTVQDLTEMWNASLPVPMPRSVRNQLTEWWQSYGQTRIYRNATLIEFGDDFALTEMKAVTSLGKAIVAELSPRLVLIDRNAVTDLVAQLEKAGYTPKLN